MARFDYRALSRDGKAVQGSVTADRMELASRELRAQGLTLLSLQAGKGSSVVAGTVGKGSAGSDQVLSVTRDLAVLLRAGLPIDRALKVMMEMAGDASLRELLEELLNGVKGGKGFSEALQPYRGTFGNFYINMVRAGEASGQLDEVLNRLAKYLESTRAIRSSVISALIYPGILLTVAVLSVGGMLGFVVPQFKELFADMGDNLPALTSAVVAAGDTLSTHGWWLLILLVAAGFGLRNWLRSDSGRERMDRLVLRLPLLGATVFKYEVARFAHTAGTLLGSGVPLLKSVGIAVDTVENRQVKQALGNLEPTIKRGGRMSEALSAAGVFSPMVIQMVRVGEESGSLDSMMTELAEIYDGEVQAGIKRSLTLLEPVLILVMGGTIAVVIIAVLMGIMSVNDLAV